MLDENDVISAVCSHLKNQSWEIRQGLHTTEKGIDIIAKNKITGQQLLIEAKGGTSSKKGSKLYGKPFTQPQVINRVSKGFFTAAKLRDQIKNSGKIYLALPDTTNFRKYIEQIKSFLLKLEVKIFWVDESKKVQEWP